MINLILMDIEGPKAIGKTTVTNKLMNKYQKELDEKSENSRKMFNGKIIYHHFYGENIMTQQKVAEDAARKKQAFVYDRGFLSSMIYTYLYNIKSNLDIDWDNMKIRSGDFFNIVTTKDDLEYIIQHVKHYIIMFADNEDTLINFMQERAKTENRYDSPEERETLFEQNYLFKMYGKLFAKKFDNVTLIEVGQNHTKKLISNNLEYWKNLGEQELLSQLLEN